MLTVLYMLLTFAVAIALEYSVRTFKNGIGMVDFIRSRVVLDTLTSCPDDKESSTERDDLDYKAALFDEARRRLIRAYYVLAAACLVGPIVIVLIAMK